ncbi:hypothetical protein R3P38DRAFT_3236549 [Favolaschia claudopus]|uniref:RING-type E3 ubiquitin transferase n=1 Tax=Favolaschia claudopus TaxID=2862362 RepID=A0AAV9ZDL0_9AGAR
MVGPRAALYQTKLAGYLLVQKNSLGADNAPTRFVSFEGKQWFPIDVDQGDRDNPIDVDLWVCMREHPMESGSITTSKNMIIKDPKVFQCGICWETLCKPVIPMCMHVYCFSCLFKWVNRGHHSCPICRAHIGEEPIRDDAFETELDDAIKQGLVDCPSAKVDKCYAWTGVTFRSLE